MAPSGSSLAARKYPLEDWQGKDRIGIIDEKVIVWLENKWDSKKRFAIGLLSASSLEPLRLLEVAVGGWTCDCKEICEIDGLLYVRVELLKLNSRRDTDTYTANLLIDVKQEAFVGYFADERDSVLWHQHEAYWKGLL